MIFLGSVLLTAKVGHPSPTHLLISLSQLPGGEESVGVVKDEKERMRERVKDN